MVIEPIRLAFYVHPLDVSSFEVSIRSVRENSGRNDLVRVLELRFNGSCYEYIVGFADAYDIYRLGVYYHDVSCCKKK